MIAEILRKKIGFNVDSIGGRKVASDVMYRMRQCGIATMERYGEFLTRSPEELDRLIEMITVPETWFFRLKNAFDYLESHVRSEVTKKGLQTKIKVLSIPCSSGEEPYSIAMILMECGLRQENFVIDAADINGVSLARAKEGIYTRNSFRGERTELIGKYFKPTGNFFAIAPEVKDAVRFFRQNLLEYIPPSEKYDIIFCRNMLIYLDSEHQQQCVDILSRSLKDDGLLFLGHSESGILFNTAFTSVKINGCFTFQKTTITPQTATSVKPAIHRNAPAAPTTKTYRSQTTLPERQIRLHKETKTTGPVAAPATTSAEPETSPEKKHELLLQAEQLADNGDLTNAEERCRRYLSTNKLDARGYFLLGIVLLSAQRHTEAESYFQKALYLNPDYQEALLSMAVIKDHAGDVQRATAYRERARRTHNQGHQV